MRIKLTAEFILVESKNPKDDNEVELARQLKHDMKKLFSKYVVGWGITQPEITIEHRVAKTGYGAYETEWQEIKEGE